MSIVRGSTLRPIICRFSAEGGLLFWAVWPDTLSLAGGRGYGSYTTLLLLIWRRVWLSYSKNYIYIYITTRSRDPAHQELLISDTAKRGSRIILDAQDNKGHGLIPTRNIYIIYHDQSILNHAILFRNWHSQNNDDGRGLYISTKPASSTFLSGNGIEIDPLPSDVASIISTKHLFVLWLVWSGALATGSWDP